MSSTPITDINNDGGRFIELIGMPPADIVNGHSGTAAAMVDAQGRELSGLPSSTEAQHLNRLSFPPVPKAASSDIDVVPKETITVVDRLDVEMEDPFVLESFDSLIQAHFDLGMDFILARVVSSTHPTASDIKSKDNIYVNYYAAHQINKSLFRTQPDEGLLHRMKTKNPMNNLNIVGDVHYFVVKFPGCPPLLQPSKLVDQDDINNVIGNNNNVTSAAGMITKSSGNEVKSPPTPPTSIRSVTPSNETAVEPSSDEMKASEPTVKYIAQYYATDDDFLMRRTVREYFKQNSANPEDIFLYTLFGNSQHNGDSFSSPLVSDPTVPNAVSESIDIAVKRYLSQKQRSPSQAMAGRGDTPTSTVSLLPADDMIPLGQSAIGSTGNNNVDMSGLERFRMFCGRAVDRMTGRQISSTPRNLDQSMQLPFTRPHHHANNSNLSVSTLYNSNSPAPMTSRTGNSRFWTSNRREALSKLLIFLGFVALLFGAVLVIGPRNGFGFILSLVVISWLFVVFWRVATPADDEDGDDMRGGRIGYRN